MSASGCAFTSRVDWSFSAPARSCAKRTTGLRKPSSVFASSGSKRRLSPTAEGESKNEESISRVPKPWIGDLRRLHEGLHPGGLQTIHERRRVGVEPDVSGCQV